MLAGGEVEKSACALRFKRTTADLLLCRYSRDQGSNFIRSPSGDVDQTLMSNEFGGDGENFHFCQIESALEREGSLNRPIARLSATRCRNIVLS